MNNSHHNDIFVTEIVNQIKSPNRNWKHRFGYVYKTKQRFHVEGRTKLNVRMIDGYRSLYEYSDNKWSSREIIHLIIGLRNNGIYISYIGFNNKNQLVFNIYRIRKSLNTNKIKAGTKFRFIIDNVDEILC